MANGKWIILDGGGWGINADGLADVCESCCETLVPLVPEIGTWPFIVPDVDGFPALYYSSGTGPYGGPPAFIRAGNASGSGAWRTPQSASNTRYINNQEPCGWLGATATDPGRVFSGKTNGSGSAFQLDLADDDPATSFTLTATDIIHGAFGPEMSASILLSNDKIGWIGTNAGVTEWYYSDTADGLLYTGPVAASIYITFGQLRLAVSNPSFIYTVQTGFGFNIGNYADLRYGDDASGTTWSTAPSALNAGLGDRSWGGFTENYKPFDHQDCGSVIGSVGHLTSTHVSFTGERGLIFYSIDTAYTAWTAKLNIPNQWNAGVAATTAAGLTGHSATPVSAALAYDSVAGEIVCHWSTQALENEPGTGVCTPTYFGSYCYYAPEDTFRAIYESRSSDNGVTWSEPIAIYKVPLVVNTNDYLDGIDCKFDGTDVLTAWHWDYDNSLYYNGNLVGV